jgi:hypothetical protein
MNAAQKQTNADHVDHKETQLSKEAAAKMNVVQPDPANVPPANKGDETQNEKIPATNIQAAKHVETGDIRNQDFSVKPASKEREKQVDAGKKRKAYKAGKQILRVKAKHPRRSFQLGSHTISAQFEEFELNEAEARELGMEGPQAWLEFGDAKKMKADKDLWASTRDLDNQPL